MTLLRALNKAFKIAIPVCILSPIRSLDIVRELPFSRETLAVDGKQSCFDGGGGGGACVGSGSPITVMENTHSIPSHLGQFAQSLYGPEGKLSILFRQ